MKEDFIKRQNKRSEKIESLINEFGSIDNIPSKFKDDIIKRSDERFAENQRNSYFNLE